MTPRTALGWAGLLGLTGVAAGAFGAHGLRGTVLASDLEIWRTASHYQQIHAAVLVGVAAWLHVHPSRILSAAAVAFAGGAVVFCGPLYAMVLGAPRVFGALTPLGGLAWLAGWGLLVVGAARMARVAPAQDG